MKSEHNEVYETIKRGLEDALNGRVTEHMVEYAPVVRCRDCKWWDKVDNIDGVNYGTCERKCTAIRKDVIPNENWFCADGEVATVKNEDSKTSGDVK